jgi:hypothetical protein
MPLIKRRFVLVDASGRVWKPNWERCPSQMLCASIVCELTKPQ